MTPSLFQQPPRGLAASASTCGLPPSRSTRRSLPPVKMPSERLSGDQNGRLVFSPPATSAAVGLSKRLTQSCTVPFASGAVNATERPSGETAGKTPRVKSASGGSTENQIDWAAGTDGLNSSVAPSATAAIP